MDASKNTKSRVVVSVYKVFGWAVGFESRSISVTDLLVQLLYKFFLKMFYQN